MGDTTQRRGAARVLQRLRKIFRWVRISVWLVILVIVAAIAYLHMAGLPDFVKNPLLKELHSRGVEAKFSEMRLAWNHDILIQDFALFRAGDSLSPSLSAGAAEVKLDYPALLSRQFKISALNIVKGQLSVPLAGSNTPPLSLDSIHVALKFLPGDRVQLESATGNFHGIAIELDGVLTNFSAIRDWNFQGAAQTGITNRQNWPEILQQVANIANRVAFTAPPKLTGRIVGDARDPNSLRGDLSLMAAGAITPWGEMTHFKLSAHCSRILDPGSETFAKLRISAATLATTWGGGSQIDLQMTLRHNPLQWSHLDGAAKFSADQPHVSWSESSTNWIRASGLKWNGAVTFEAGTNFLLHAAQGDLHARRVESAWGAVGQADILLRTSRTNAPRLADSSWGAWAFFEPYVTDWQAETRAIKAGGFDIQKLDCSGQWSAPRVTIQKLESTLYGGELHATAHLDVASRELSVKNTLNFDPTRLGASLGPELKEFLTQFAFQTGPRIQNEGKVTLPPWVARPSGWEQDLARSIQLTGTVQADKGAYRDIAFDSGAVAYFYTNLTWYLPRLHAICPGGDFYMDLLCNNGNKDYEFTFDTQLDPRLLKIYFDWLPHRDEWLNRFHYSTPPKIHTRLQGNWDQEDLLSVTSQIAATNFSFYGQPVSALKAFLTYSNSVLDIKNFLVSQHDHRLTGPRVRADFSKDTMSFTNCFSTLDAEWLPRLFGTNLPSFFSEIGFERPPSVEVNGSFSLTNSEATDLHFLVSGDRFSWKKLKIDNICGNVDWVTNRVTLGNVQAKLYGEGTGTGWAQFQANPTNGTDVRFQAAIANADMAAVVHGLLEKTNQIEGKLEATLAASGNSENRKTWQGSGAANVRDALLWDIPVFGLVSHVLNQIVPGAGNSRARKASATFLINNGVLSSEDLIIEATTFRLLYRGIISNAPPEIKATVEVQALRNAPLVGPIIGMVLMPLEKIAEVRITGPLAHPLREPVYFPFPVLLDSIFHPLHSLRSLLPSGSSKRTPQSPDNKIPQN